MLINILLVGIGGFFGSIARYLSFCGISKLMNPSFPYGTLFVNGTGSFLIGIALAIPAPIIHYRLWLLFVTGFLGGFTTFSAFSAETVSMIHRGAYAIAGFNIFANLLISISFTLAGCALFRYILKV